MIDVTQYIISIGVFVCVLRGNIKTFCSEIFVWQFIYLNFLFRILVMPSFISLCGDIESKPGPNQLKQPSFCQISLRSITADGDNSNSIGKFKEFEAFVSSHDFDVIGITKTWLDNSIDNEKIKYILDNKSIYVPDPRRSITPRWLVYVCTLILTSRLKGFRN